MHYKTHNLGYPRMGEHRELKRVLESYWNGKATEADLMKVASELRTSHWKTQANTGINLVPVNDFSFYDHVLDTTLLLGNVPTRFQWDSKETTLDLYFRMARGTSNDVGDSQNTHACEMSKWFDTNYHYIVPEFHPERTFKLTSTKLFDELTEFTKTFATNEETTTPETKVVLVGPLTYLYLGKMEAGTKKSFDKYTLLEQLLPVYCELLRQLGERNVHWVQFDEPILSLNLGEHVREFFGATYKTLAEVLSGSKTQLMVATTFGELRDNLKTFTKLPVHGLHIDAVRGASEVETIAKETTTATTLSLGLVDGRNVWKTDYEAALKTIRTVQECETTTFGGDNTTLMVGPSCSLLHVPISLESETDLNPELKRWMSFAKEKLQEVVEVASLARDGEPTNSALATALETNREATRSRANSPLIHNTETQARMRTRSEAPTPERSPFSVRQGLQATKHPMPMLPSTTIGSFPQTSEIRRVRRQFKNQTIDALEYETFMKGEIENMIRRQEEVGLDVLVHGEPERNDMVEYFGEQLQGYAFTKNGWVQSYGSRCVKPPILYGDVWRPEAMTVKWATWAQSLTQKPVKGMLTGPITMMQWSFVRNDQSRETTAKQLAYALNDEVLDLERSGITIIQIDEPALREGLPLRQEDWDEYLVWSVDAFQKTYAGVQDTTQIHTHMCYSEFGDILEAIANLDADVISMETSRSQMELLEDFSDFKYPNAIGPGVYDIHSSRIPSVEEIVGLLNKALQVIPAKNLWVNPDCGLKTRTWDEVEAALRNMITATQQVRQNLRMKQEVV